MLEKFYDEVKFVSQEIGLISTKNTVLMIVSQVVKLTFILNKIIN